MTVQSSFSTAPSIGYAGTLDSNMAHDVITMKNAETSASIAFGRAVKFKDTVSSDKDAVLPASENDLIIGIVLRADTYGVKWTDLNSNSYGQLDSTGVMTGAFMNVLRRGRVLVVCEDAVEAGDKLWVRAVSAEDGTEYYGGLTNADDGSDTIDCTSKGTWMTSASAGGLAWLDVNF
jgi:hypothetical protein